jgi:hypothetical protein
MATLSHGFVQLYQFPAKAGGLVEHLVLVTEHFLPAPVAGRDRMEDDPPIGGEVLKTEDVTVAAHRLRASNFFRAILRLDHSIAKGLSRVLRRRFTYPPKLLLQGLHHTLRSKNVCGLHNVGQCWNPFGERSPVVEVSYW